MKVLIESKDGVKQPVRINEWNLERLKEKYGDRLTVPAYARLRVKIERFTCVKCKSMQPIIEMYNENVCFECKYREKK